METRAADIERAIERMTVTLESAGIWVTGQRDGAVVTLIGEVDSRENRDAALDVARATIGQAGALIVDAIEIQPSLAGEAFAEELTTRSPDDATDMAGSSLDLPAGAVDVEPDFTGRIGATDPMTAAEEGEPWFAPTDPVVAATGDRRGLAVLNGFAPTSDDLETRRAGAGISDRLIEERVARALADDALTSDLDIRVSVRAGVAHLRGTAPTLEDAENAEAVASGVGGVRQVKESLRIGTFREQP